MELAIVLVATAALFAAEKMTVGQWWRANEHARKVVGVGSGLAMMLLGVPLGLIEWSCWLVTVAIFAVAGSIDLAWEVTINERRRQLEERERMLEVILRKADLAAVLQTIEGRDGGTANESGDQILRGRDS